MDMVPLWKYFCANKSVSKIDCLYWTWDLGELLPVRVDSTDVDRPAVRLSPCVQEIRVRFTVLFEALGQEASERETSEKIWHLFSTELKLSPFPHCKSLVDTLTSSPMLWEMN